MKTCQTCADEVCPDRGTEQGACDDWTSREEAKPYPIQVDALALVQAQLDDLQQQFTRFERAASDFIRALTGSD